MGWVLREPPPCLRDSPEFVGATFCRGPRPGRTGAVTRGAHTPKSLDSEGLTTAAGGSGPGLRESKLPTRHRLISIIGDRCARSRGTPVGFPWEMGGTLDWPRIIKYCLAYRSRVDSKSVGQV